MATRPPPPPTWTRWRLKDSCSPSSTPPALCAVPPGKAVLYWLLDKQLNLGFLIGDKQNLVLFSSPTYLGLASHSLCKGVWLMRLPTHLFIHTPQSPNIVYNHAAVNVYDFLCYRCKIGKLFSQWSSPGVVWRAVLYWSYKPHPLQRGRVWSCCSWWAVAEEANYQK